MRLLLAAAIACVLAPAAHADLRKTCFETVPTFRLSGLVCTKVPGGVG